MIPTLTTTRLVLRPFTAGDAEPLHRLLGGKDVLRYFPNPDPPPPDRVQKLIVQQLAHWGEHGYGWWAVEQRAKQGLMGWAGLQFLPETQETEVAYLLGNAFWGLGFATEAARASLDYGFGEHKLECVVGIVHPENKASIHVIEKLGMSCSGEHVYFGMQVLRYSISGVVVHRKA